MKLSYRALVCYSGLAASSALLLSLLSALLWSFDKVNSTHCRVANVFPSISAVIGGSFPAIYLWRIGVSLFITQRFLDAFLYFLHYQQAFKFDCSSTSSSFAPYALSFNRNLQVGSNFLHALAISRVNAACCVCLVTENICLLLLTQVSSLDHYSVHEASRYLLLPLCWFSLSFPTHPLCIYQSINLSFILSSLPPSLFIYLRLLFLFPIFGAA